MKIDSHQVPKKYFEYFIGKLKAQVNGVRLVSHKAQPSYKSLTRKISYKILTLNIFLKPWKKGMYLLFKMSCIQETAQWKGNR